MTRKLPQDPPDLKRRERPDMVTQLRTYQLISPLFGGGSTPAAPDRVTVVRASEVRGQLRFWWRATRGGQFGNDLQALRQLEGKIWGLAARPDDEQHAGGHSPILVAISDWATGSTDVPYMIQGTRQQPRLVARPGSAAPEYAAFPLQPKKEDQLPGMPIPPVYNDVRFSLHLTFPPALRAELDAALWAWETFGGLGARTRRGFGALRLESVNGQQHTDLPPATVKQCRQWLQRKLKQHVQATNWPENLPHVSPQTQFKLQRGAKGNTLDAWHELIRQLKLFRQQRRDKNTGEIKPIGRSNWPEPNAIRRAFSQPARGPHERRLLDKYPRAQFGLPIVFHLPHDPVINNVTLQGATKGHTRFASPLILKPLMCAEQYAMGLALILEGSHLPASLTIQSDAGSRDELDAEVTGAEATRIPPLGGNADVLQAFLNILSEE